MKSTQRRRQADIINIVRNLGGTTAEQLADHFDVSMRTVYRDVATLQRAGVPILGTPGEGYAFDERAPVVAGLSTHEVEELCRAAGVGLTAARACEGDVDVLAAVRALDRLADALPAALREDLFGRHAS